MAVKVLVKPLATDGAVGLMLMLVSTASVTVMATVGAAMPLSDAESVVLPKATPVATPLALRVTSVLLPDVHVTWLVMSAVVALE